MAVCASASAAQRAVGSSRGSPARNRYLSLRVSYFFMNDVSCFFSTRIAVGDVNIDVTFQSCTIFHQIPASGRIGTPSYMIVVEPLMSGAYTMYEWPTTQPMSDVEKYASPGFEQKMCSIDAGGEARRGESAEHHRMDGADAHRGEHGEHRLGHHRHVDEDAIALAHAQRANDRRAAIHLVGELRIGEHALLVDLRRDPHQRGLRGSRRKVAVDRVVAQVRHPADEPARERRLRVVENLVERPVPVDALRLARPEGLGFVYGFAVEVAVVHRLTSTTIRPRTCPAMKSAAQSSTAARGISEVIDCSLPGSRSRTRGSQARCRRSIGQVTLLMPSSLMPRRMKGATVTGKSIPCAKPQAVTTPSSMVCAHALASVWLPTASTTPAQRCFCRGLPGWESSARSMTSAAPSDCR